MCKRNAQTTIRVYIHDVTHGAWPLTVSANPNQFRTNMGQPCSPIYSMHFIHVNTSSARLRFAVKYLVGTAPYILSYTSLWVHFGLAIGGQLVEQLHPFADRLVVLEQQLF